MAKGPKQKTHHATKKVLKVRNGGPITYKKSNGNHMTAKDSAKAVRQRRNKGTLSKGDYNRLKSVI